MTPLDLFREPSDRLCHFGGGSGGGGGGGIEGKIYQPQNQPGIDTGWNTLFSNLQDQYSAGTSPGQQWAPWAQQTGNNIIYNPYQNQALDAASVATGYQQQMVPQELNAAQGIYNYGQLAGPYGQLALQQGQNPAYGQAAQMGQMNAAGLQPNIAALQGMGMADMQSGFDPQGALYNRTQSRLSDQVNAQLANQGLASSPYGASVAANAMKDFNIDWQNQQLQRQLAAGQGASQMFGAQASQGNAALGDILGPANAMGAAQQQAAGTYGQFGQSMQAGAAGAQSLTNRTLQDIATYGALPYQQYNSIQGNDFGAIQNAINLGNRQYDLPEQLMGSAQSYMQLGQSANATAAQNMLAQNQQMMQGLSGLGGLVGGLNNWGSMGSGGALGSLFGGGGTGVADVFSGGSAAADAMGDFGGGGMLASGLLSSLGGMSSDRRLKTDITPVGKLDNGLIVYFYRYKSDQTPRIGLMADEVEKLHPKAVSIDPRGFKVVRYDLAVA